MKNVFKLKYLSCNNKSLTDIGFDKTYCQKAVEKHVFKTIKIYNLTCAQSNILKQTALSCGTDCSVHREVITGKIELSDCILSGSINELFKIVEKLKYQPLKLSCLADEIKQLLSEKIQPISVREIVIDWKRPYLMGILNITPDSFSDGGLYETTEKAVNHYKMLVEKGADMIDIGGESTRPYSSPVDIEEEINRVIPLINAIRELDSKTILSIDTRNAITAGKAIEAGADIINDVSGCEWDERMIEVIKEKNCPVILNHSKGTPDTMQDNTNSSDIVEEIFNFLSTKIEDLEEFGIDRSKIIIDPGLGFGKSTEQNFEIINRLEEFSSLGCPILLGHSRKNFIKETIESTDIAELDIASAILTQKLIDKKVNILRVHNIQINKTAVNLNKSFV